MQWNLQSNACDVLALGPRTAGRLATVGIHTVAELLAAKPQATAHRLALPVETLVAWQYEAQLIVALPQLPPLAARTLASAGLRTEIHRCTPTQLFATLEAAQQKNPASWLAQTKLPTLAEVSRWISAAQPVEKSYAA